MGDAIRANLDTHLQTAGMKAMSDPKAYPSFNDLMARVGILLLQWGFLEKAMRDCRKNVSKLSRIPELNDARRIRNLVAHGICRASADPSKSGEPFVSCFAADGSVLDVSYTMLGDAAATIDAYRRQTFRSPPST